MKTHPKALYLLNFISMWENFSYYGMRLLLVLYMTKDMALGDKEALGLYALYTALLELSGVAGGIAADNYFGLRRSIGFGGWTIALGHLCLNFASMDHFFHLGLALIVIGTGLFRSNVAALLGSFYEKGDPRQAAGYTLYYTGINMGGFLATLLCGAIAELYGWHMGFSLAAFGMIAGNIALFMGQSLLDQGKEKKLKSINKDMKIIAVTTLGALLVTLLLSFQEIASFLVPAIALAIGLYIYKELKQHKSFDAKALKALFTTFLLMVIFYGCEELMGSTFMLFTERHVDKSFMAFNIPASSLLMFNPLTILLAGPLLSRFWQKRPLKGALKIAISFLLLGSAFMLLAIGCCYAGPQSGVSLPLVAVSVVLMALGEIFIGPTVYAAGAAAAPDSHRGLSMGIISLGFAFANLGSGYLSLFMAVENVESSAFVYRQGFEVIGYALLALSLLLIIPLKFKLKEHLT